MARVFRAAILMACILSAGSGFRCRWCMCPAGANYTNPANPTGAHVTLASLGITNCYYIAAGGSDSNSGTSESSPLAARSIDAELLIHLCGCQCKPRHTTGRDRASSSVVEIRGTSGITQETTRVVCGNGIHHPADLTERPHRRSIWASIRRGIPVDRGRGRSSQLITRCATQAPPARCRTEIPAQGRPTPLGSQVTTFRLALIRFWRMVGALMISSPR